MQKEYNKLEIIDLMFDFFKEVRKENSFNEPAVEIIDGKIKLICQYVIHQGIQKVNKNHQEYESFYFLIRQYKNGRYKLLYKFKRKDGKETVKTINNKKDIKDFLKRNLRLT